MKAFFDTNVVASALDPDSPEKCQVSRELLRTHRAEGTAVISTQVLLETFRVCVGKFKLAPQDAKSHVQDLMSLEIVVVRTDAIIDAIDLVITNQIAVWDAMILSAALSAKCSTVYSEDMQDGFRVRGLTVVNPFRE